MTAMKKHISIYSASTLLLMVAVCMAGLTGCISSKKIHYFQGADSLFVKAQPIMQKYEMRLKPADQIMIMASSSEPELLESFSQSVMIGGVSNRGGSTSNYGNANSTLGSVVAFTVDNQGYVFLPRLGRLKVSGLTTMECAELVKQLLVEKGKISDPEVKVTLLNARVTVIGATSSKVVELKSERNTIVDVLAQCNDVSDMGLRYNIRLFREEEGERKLYLVDLTKADVFENPGFYVQQNDMIYVEYNKKKNISSNPFYAFMSAGVSIIGAIMTAVSLVFLIKK